MVIRKFSFKGSDISRFRDLIFQVTNGIYDDSDIQNIIREFNRSVKNYENKKDRLAEWKLSGFAPIIISLTGATMMTKNPELCIPMAGVPLITWFLEVLNNKRSHNEFIGSALDKIEALTMRTRPEVILVARMKGKK